MAPARCRNGFGLGIGIGRAAAVDNSVGKSLSLDVEARFDEPVAHRVSVACEEFD
jgi:hypothetical protein